MEISVKFDLFIIYLAQAKDPVQRNKNNNSQSFKPTKKLTKIEAIQEEVEESPNQRKESKLLQRKILGKLNINNGKLNSKRNLKLNSNERPSELLLLNEIQTKKSTDKIPPIKAFYSSKKDIPVLLIKSDKISLDASPCIPQISTKQNLDQEKEKKEISNLLNLDTCNNSTHTSHSPLRPNPNLIFNSFKKERNLNSASTCEFTAEANNKKNVFEGKTVDDVNNARIHLGSANNKYSPLESNALINLPSKRPLSNFNSIDGNLWANVQEEGVLQTLDNVKYSNLKKNHFRLKLPGNKRNISLDCRKKSSGKLPSNEEEQNKKFHKSKLEKVLMSPKVGDSLINKYNLEANTQGLRSTKNKFTSSMD